MQIYDSLKTLYQWDLNRKITSNDFKVGDEIHFFNIKQPTALVVIAYELDGKVVADIPNILLQSSQPITVYQYINDGNIAQTVKEFQLKVKQRAKPDDYVYTETELYTIKTAVDKALEDAKASGEFDGADGKDGKDGENGLDGKNGVDGKDGKNGQDGYTPIKGVDYYTDVEKTELIVEIETAVTGDIETALDKIIAIQETLMGGDA